MINMIKRFTLAFVITVWGGVLSQGWNEYPDYTVCDTTECYRSAANLMQSMDRSVDPCQDFFKFACGNWAKAHPIPDTSNHNCWPVEASSRILRKIRDALEQEANETEALPVTQARILYQTCMDTDGLDTLGLEPMIRILKRIGLPPHPHFLPSRRHERMFDLIPVIVKAKRFLALDLLIGLSMGVTDAPEINTLKLSAPQVLTPLPSFEEGEDMDMFPGYLDYVHKSLLKIHPAGRNKSFNDTAKRLAESIYDLEVKLYKLREQHDGDEEIMLTMTELQGFTDHTVKGNFKINWTEYFDLMFDGINIRQREEKLDKVILSDDSYFEALLKLLSETPRHTIELTVWWKVVKALLPHTTSEMRTLKDRYIEKRLGTKTAQSRTMFCTRAVKSNMFMALGHLMLMAEPEFEDKKKKVEEVMGDIQRAFYSLIQAHDWADSPTKVKVLKKTKDVHTYIGYPSWLSNKQVLQYYFDKLEVNETKTFLDNLLSVLELRTTNTLYTLGFPFGGKSMIFRGDPLKVNAFYWARANSVIVPAGILQFPYFGQGLEVLNFATTGVLLGHELTHAFDTQGMRYDKSGNKLNEHDFLPLAAENTDCFVSQYSNYSVPDTDFMVDGNRTLNDNLADDGGLRTAWQAYQTFLEKNGPEPKLPGLEVFTHQELFFLQYANLWCGEWSKEYLQGSENNSHAPGYFRVMGPLSNSQAFADIWECSKGTPMNPNRERCRIW